MTGPATEISVDAPTTLPTSSAPKTSLVDRVGGIVAQPRAAFRGLIDDERASLTEPLAIFAVVVLALHAGETYRLLALFGEAPLIVARRLLDVVVRAGRADLGVLCGAAVVVALLARAHGQRAVGAVVATAYLVVPLAVLKAVGGVLAALGLDLWWLPHRAVDGMAVVVNGQVSWLRFAVKSAVAYLPGLAVLVDWLRCARARATPSPARPFIARRGAAVVVIAMLAAVLAAASTVVRRADQLRPRLPGDLFPSVPLRVLPGATPSVVGDRKRVDLLQIARAPTTRVLVVDFWASWCAPCRKTLPGLSALAQERSGEGVVVVGVNREPYDVPAAQKTWAELAPSFGSLVDDRGLGETIGLTSLPSSFVIDSTGTIRHIHLGLTDIDTLRAEVDALLREAPR